MPFQDNAFVRNQNFVRDRDLGPPDNTISAEKVDDEFGNVAGGLTTLKTGLDTLQKSVAEGAAGAYTKKEADERFVKTEGGLAKAGDKTAGAITLGGKPGAAKGIVAAGTVKFDYADGNVQSITVNGPLTFTFDNLPDIGGTLQINLTIISGSITIPDTTWWELGGGEKSTTFSDLGLSLKTGRPYRLFIENVAGFRTGILQ